MTNFEFGDRLEIDPFPTYNDYIYYDLAADDTRFYTDSENLPYIVKGFTDAHKALNKMVYSKYQTQFRGKILTTKKIKEVMNSARYPIRVVLKGFSYFMGKGFLARHLIENKYEYLFVACVNGAKSVYKDISEVKFFISRNIYLEENKPILPAVKDFMNAHRGDIVITNNIHSYVGEVIKIPPGGTLDQQKKYKKAVVIECLKDVLK